MFKTIPLYDETGLGLPYPVVLIDGAEEEIDDASGLRVGVSVPDLEQLVMSVVIARILEPIQLSGQEVKFIRNVLAMSATAFANALTLDKATFSRWEHDKQVCGEWADKQVRMIAVIKLASLVPHLSLDPTTVVSMRIEKAAPGWTPRIEMRRVPVSSNAGGSASKTAWDALPLAA